MASHGDPRGAFAFSPSTVTISAAEYWARQVKPGDDTEYVASPLRTSISHHSVIVES